MPVEEKIPHMLTWCSLTQKIMVQCHLHRSALTKTVRECSLVLRDGVKDFADLLHENKIPLLIFSAGLGDVIRLLLQRFTMYTDNVRVISNLMRFDEDIWFFHLLTSNFIISVIIYSVDKSTTSPQGVLTAFEEPVIHTFNKTAASIVTLGSGDGKTSLERPCVLLLGDSTGDVHMADGTTVGDPDGNQGIVLRIGFLNDRVDEQLEKYKLLYDIVLVNEDTFQIPLTVIRSMLRYWKSDTENGQIQSSDGDCQ
ncbi:unnamed protein product [Echinostoma caproni]|uniref:5'-nucleotidase n=1 Tax=Echinostoma caproni TaxID=27848 RepID=A0A183AH60_9TREM|nr:unnamed protein product [Echinostoma caproni]